MWYAEEAFKAFLTESGIPFLDMDAIEDPLILRMLDDTVDGVYRLLLCTKVQPSLRGLDYRAPQWGIKMVFTRQLQNHRESF